MSVPDRAVEAAEKALQKRYNLRLALEAAAPHIIEQFIDGLTDDNWWLARASQILSKYDSALDRATSDGVALAEAGDYIRAELKRLIPTPEGKKDERR